MNNYLLSFLLFLISQTAFTQDSEWITEEVLTQLSEIRQELASLRQEISSLKLSGGGQEILTVNIPVDRPIMGLIDASIVILEFSDFQCPYCKRHSQETLPDLKKNYIDTGDIQYAVMDFPLAFHSLAKPAAIAARCAAEQDYDAYWYFHEHFFGDMANALAEAGYEAIAKDANLDVSKFNTCLKNPNIANDVDEQMGYGGSLGVTGTPAFFIGIKEGDELVDVQMLSGAQPYSVFSQVIQRLLDKS